MLNLVRLLQDAPLNRNRRLSTWLGFLRWQVASRLHRGHLVIDWVDDARLLVANGQTGLTGNIYCGLMEFTEMAFVLKAMRSSDIFVDIGANIGAYSVLASKVVGATSFAFEPVPSTFQRLVDQLGLNRINDRVHPFNLGVGAQEAVLRFTTSKDTMNRVELEAADGQGIDVRVVSLDSQDILGSGRDVFVKIDVEGFEFNVLRGGESFFEDPRVRAIIIEMNGNGLKYGFSDDSIHDWLVGKGFAPVSFDAAARRVERAAGFNRSGNTIYARDIDFLAQRCADAPDHVVKTAGDSVV